MIDSTADTPPGAAARCSRKHAEDTVTGSSHPTLPPSVRQGLEASPVGSKWLPHAMARQRFVQRLMWFIYDRCRQLDPERAAEVTEIVITSMSKKIGSFNHGRGNSFRRWLSVVTRNALYDVYRKEQRERLPTCGSDALESAGRVDDSMQSLEEGYAQEMCRVAMKRAKRAFAPGELLVLNWRLRHRFDYRQIARLIGQRDDPVSLNRMAQRVSRTRRRLREEYRRQFEQIEAQGA